MLARMEPLLILLFLVGVGALWMSVAARRAEGRLAPRVSGAPSRTSEAPRPAAAEAAPSAAPDASALPAPAPPPPAPIPDQKPEDRRKHPRIQTDQTFTVTPFAGRAMMAQCCDVSAGGMRFGMVGCTMRAGDLVRVTFNIGSETIAAIGSVLRVRELDPITTEVSLEFVRLDPWATQLLEQALRDGA